MKKYEAPVVHCEYAVAAESLAQLLEEAFRLYLAHIRDEDLKPLFLSKHGGSNATLCCSQYHHFTHNIIIPLFSVDAVRSFPPLPRHHLTFKVMMVSAASMIVIIQKRTVIFDSSQQPLGQLHSTLMSGVS